MRVQQFIFATSCIASFVVAVPSQVAAQSKAIASVRRMLEPYDGSVSDRHLQAFEKSHPACAMWTDWRKLCQRLGPKHTTVCDVDLSYPAKPSAPFCERETGYVMFMGGDGPDKETRAERRSRLRFSRAGRPDFVLDRVWRDHRPFNGRTLAALSYRGCLVWSYEAGSEDAEDVRKCATDGRGGMPSCAKSLPPSKRRTPVCEEIRPYDPCDYHRWSQDDHEVMKFYRREEQEAADNDLNSGSVDVLVGYDPTAWPVYGFKCPAVK